MSPLDWAVIAGGLAAIAAVLWYFFGAERAASAPRDAPRELDP